jgi:hypothetical protein
MPTQIKRLKTNKLFYNKWPYKVECIIPGANRITIYGPDRVLAWCKEEATMGGNNRHIDKAEIKKFIGLSMSFIENKDNIRIRTEGGHFNLFFKDPALLDDILKALKPWVWNIFEPSSEEELKFLLDNENKKVLCDELPHNKYIYKVVMRSSNVNSKEQFLNWSNNYTEDQIKISGQTEKWLRGQYSYKQDPFFYVKDAPMLTMTRLFLGDGVRKVFEYVPRNSLEKG